eukprot:TRINITY_DN2607_c0_g1_i1.p2 TRINITY_DN2607_c0_g1~~TRINITY_DN2607_c0_g1_i1.p2  ORF type:complete len:105 (-),score=8.78 TRINITY_DN2607_c0_g1_i1:427-741(-)
MNVVNEAFVARDLRFEIFTDGIAFRRFGAVSGSEPEAGDGSGFMTWTKGGGVVVSVSLERDFWRAFVRMSVSRAKFPEIQVSGKVEDRKVQGSRLEMLSEDAIF